MTTKRCFIDVETTGLDKVKNGIHQIAMLVEIDGKIVHELIQKVKPFPTDEIDPDALKISGVKIEDFGELINPEKNGVEARGLEADLERLQRGGDEYIFPRTAYFEFIDEPLKHINKFNPTEKFQFIGYNAPFDWKFMWEWFKKCGDKYFGSFFFFPPLDVMNKAAWHLEPVRQKMKDFKLHTVAKELGLELEDEKLHDAYYDISLTRKMYYVLKNKNGDQNGNI